MSPVRSFPMREALAGMAALAAAMGIGRFVYTPLLPGMMDGLSMTAADAGLIASANYAGYLVGAIAAAGSWGQGRERAVALWSLAISTLLLAVMALVSGIGAFLLIRFAAGIASAFVMIFTATIVLARLAAAGRYELQAVLFAGVGVGIAASAMMTLLTAETGAGWRAGWIGAAALSIMGLMAVIMLLARAERTAQAGGSEPAMPMGRALIRITIAYGLFGFGYIVTATFLVAIVRQGAGGQSFEAIVWLATGLAGIPSVWLWNKVAGRLGLARTFAIGCAVEAAGVMISVMVGGYAGPLIGGILLGGTFIAVTAIGIQIGRQLAGEAPRKVLAMMTAAFGVGQIIGPVVAGTIADRTGDFVAASLVAALVLALAAAIAPHERRVSRAVR